MQPSKNGLKRHVHYLKSNDRSETIHECIFYDTETTPELCLDGKTRHRLEFGWGAYTRRDKQGKWTAPEWKRFTTGDDFWEWVVKHSKSKRTLYVWAHNQGFDYVESDGAEALKSRGFEMTDAIVDSPPFILKYRRKTSQLVLTDTLNIWRMSLAKMGKLTGLEKYGMPKKWTHSEADDIYCRRDVEIILHAVTGWADFIQREDMGKFQLTVASQSMTTFRHRYLKDDILIDDDSEALDIARAAYHGGRVECNLIGHRTGKFYLLDINSLYPDVMRRELFPLRLTGIVHDPTVEDLEYLLERYRLCAHVFVKIDRPAIPLLADHKLIFPVGEFDAYVSSPEIEYLIEHAALLRCDRAAVYEQGTPFKEYIEDLYGKRTEARLLGNLVEGEHHKLLLNSFSGKWGQNGRKWVTESRTADMTIGFRRAVDFWSDRVIHYRRFNGLWQRREDFPESANSHPAIAAHITAYGRMVLWALMRKVPPEDYLYCDTDAILCTEEGLKHLADLIDNVSLGKLKIVGEYADVIIYGPKDYVLDGKRVCKGVRYDAVPSGKSGYLQERWTGFKGLLRKLDISRSITETQVKLLSRIYTKGLVTPSGFTRPYHFTNGALTNGTGIASDDNS